jgi:hypothetical protein
MAERDTQIDREVDPDVNLGDLDLPEDGDVDIPEGGLEESTPSESGSRIRDRAGQRLGLSKRGIVFSAVVALVGVVLFGSLIPFGLVGNLLGLFVAGFIYGTVASDSRYLSVGLAGTVAGGLVSVLGNLTLTLLGPGVPIVAVGAVGGLVAGVLGHYFGRDLRDGLTRDL